MNGKKNCGGKFHAFAAFTQIKWSQNIKKNRFINNIFLTQFVKTHRLEKTTGNFWRWLLLKMEELNKMPCSEKVNGRNKTGFRFKILRGATSEVQDKTTSLVLQKQDKVWHL